MKPGTMIAGRHRVIGAGGANAFLVEDLGSGGLRGVFRWLPERTWRRGKRKLENASRLRCPHIVEVLDFGTAENGTPYIVELPLDGCEERETLADVLARRALAPEEAARVALDICLALAEARAHGIDHDDLTPSDVVLGRAGAKISGFWKLARRDEHELNVMEAGRFPGEHEVPYLPPERIESAHAVAPEPANVYAVGAILWHAIAGR